MSWAERAADRSPLVQRSRTRSLQQAQVIVDAARRLIGEKGESFTTQELVKEAGVALQTFYRHFGGKDQLLLAVIEDLITEAAAAYEERARAIENPVDRLHFYVTSVMRSLDATGEAAVGPRFITAEHWRLHRLYPDELALARKPFNDLVLGEINAATEAGLLHPSSPEHDAWFLSQLVTSVYHHYAFATTEESPSEVAERVWAFILAALGGSPAPPQRRGRTRRER